MGLCKCEAVAPRMHCRDEHKLATVLWNSYFKSLALSHIFELHFAGTSSTHISLSFFNKQSGKPLTASRNESVNASLAEPLQGAAN